MSARKRHESAFTRRELLAIRKVADAHIDAGIDRDLWVAISRKIATKFYLLSREQPDVDPRE